MTSAGRLRLSSRPNGGERTSGRATALATGMTADHVREPTRVDDWSQAQQLIDRADPPNAEPPAPGPTPSSVASESHRRQLERMDAVARLAGGLAHELNNLLTPILGHAEFALESLIEEDPLTGSLKQIQEAGERARTLARRLLALSRRQALDLRALDVPREISRIAGDLRRTLGDPIELDLRLDPEAGFIRADAVQFHVALRSLITHARHVLSQGGRLTLECRSVELGELDAALGLGLSAGAYVVLTLRDNGRGLSQEERDHVFEPFSSGRHHDGLSGMDLAVAYGIIRQHQGCALVSSRSGEGTTFEIYFPRCRLPTPTASPTRTESPGEQPERPIILVVEDERMVLALVRNVLTHQGYEILAASGASEAMQLARTFTGRIHLLVTDVNMPDMTGPELYERLQAMHPGLPVVFMSGYTGDLVANTLLNPAVQFLQKPFTLDSLLRKVQEVMAAHSIH